MRIILCAGISVRTGTNYIGSVFSEIPQVISIPKTYSKGEFPFFKPQVIENYDSWFDQFRKAMFADHLPKKECFAPYYGNAFLNYLEKEYNLEKECLIFVKDPNIYNIDRFYDFFPNGCLILLKRSAPDLIASSLKASIKIRNSQGWKRKFMAKIKLYLGYTMYTYAKAYTRHAEEFSRVKKKLNGKYLEIAYEDLVEQPESKIKEILNYCKIDYTEEIIKKASNAKIVGSSYFGAEANSQNWGKLDKDNTFNPIGRYRSWNFFNRYIYKRYADKGNKMSGYNHKL